MAQFSMKVLRLRIRMLLSGGMASIQLSQYCGGLDPKWCSCVPPSSKQTSWPCKNVRIPLWRSSTFIEIVQLQGENSNLHQLSKLIAPYFVEHTFTLHPFAAILCRRMHLSIHLSVLGLLGSPRKSPLNLLWYNIYIYMYIHIYIYTHVDYMFLSSFKPILDYFGLYNTYSLVN